MRLDPDELYYGAKPILLQTTLQLLSKYSEKFTSKEFSQRFGSPIYECQPIIDGLLKDGFVMLNDGNYQFTDSFSSILNAPISKGIPRKEAEILLARIIEKAKLINASPTLYGHTIQKLCIFGSYLTDKELLGDLDIGYVIEQIPDAFTAEQKKRTLHPVTYKYDSYANKKYKEVARMLKCNKKTVSIHRYDEVLSLNAPFKDIYQN